MKKYIIFLGVMVLIFTNCQDITVGYLETRDAVYAPDSMVVKSVLDPVEDGNQQVSRVFWGLLPSSIPLKALTVNTRTPRASSRCKGQG